MLTAIVTLSIGWITGGSINFVSDILPFSRRINKLSCVVCGKTISFLWYILPSKCPHCNRSWGIRHWAIQIVMPAAFLLMQLFPPDRIPPIPGMLLFAYFSLVAVMDLEHKVILHPVSITGYIIGLGIGLYLRGIISTLLGLMAGFLIMYFFYLLGALFQRFLAKRRGESEINEDEIPLGFGDVNLGGILGMVLGWPGITAGLFLAIFLAGMFSGAYIIYMLIRRQYKPFAAIPYAPFMVLAAAYLLFLL